MREALIVPVVPHVLYSYKGDMLLLQVWNTREVSSDALSEQVTEELFSLISTYSPHVAGLHARKGRKNIHE